MRSVCLYGLVLKYRIFKLGGFIIKKVYNINDNYNFLFYLKNYKLFYTVVNPVLSLIQLINIFKFYINLVLTSKKLLVTVLLNKYLVSIPTNCISKSDFFLISNFFGGIFTNFFVFSWYLVHYKNLKLKVYPSLCIILHSGLQLGILSSLYNLAVPTIGFYDNNHKSDYITFPILLDHNVYILYFFIRLFLRLLYILKVKL